MNEPDRETRPTPREWAAVFAAAGILWIVLWLLYSSPLRTTYFLMDEISYLRPQPFPILGAVWMPFVFGLSNGRPVSYFIWGIYLGIASNWDGLHWIRVFHFGVAGTALGLLLDVVYRRSRSIGWALMVVLFIATQPMTQACFAQSMVTTYWVAAGLGCAAFLYLHRHAAALSDWRAAKRQLIVAAVILLVVWMMYQPGTFCGLALAGYYALTSKPDRWPEERGAVLAFAAVLFATMSVYLVTYKLLLLVTEAGTYELVGPAFSTLTGSSIGTASSFLRLSNYLGPFEWWNYIIPMEPLSDDIFRQLASISALACLVVICCAFAIEIRRAGRSRVLERYGIAWLALLLTFVPLVADGFTMRQHVYMACVPAIALMVGYSVSVIVDALRLPRSARLLLSAGALAVFCVLAVGAHAGFERALVQPTARYYSFARQETRRAADRSFTRVVVVAPSPQCLQEPCRGMHALRMPWGDPLSLAECYRKIVQDETGRTDFDIQYVGSPNGLEKGDPSILWIDNRDVPRVEPGD